MDLLLGIDFGTTSIKVILIDKNHLKWGSWSKNTNAYNNYCKTCNINIQLAHNNQGQSMNPCLMNVHDEQNCIFIFDALRDCLLKIPIELRRRVSKIAACGQMHGIILWKKKPNFDIEDMKSLDPNNFSPLYTWQDKRCTQDFIKSLPHPCSHLKLASGFACMTIAHLQRYNPNSLNGFNFCGSIMDLFVLMISGIDKCVMSPQVAASWGYFDTANLVWNYSLLDSIGFPIRLLPDIKQEATILGECQHFFFWGRQDSGEIYGQRPLVFVALGDMQCSVLGNLIDQKTAVINIGTSSQLSTIMTSNFHPSFYSLEENDNNIDSSVEYFPFFEQRYLKVAASLNGGNILQFFVNQIVESMQQIGIDSKVDEIWINLNKTCQPISGQGPIVQKTNYDFQTSNESNRQIETNIASISTHQNKKSLNNFAIITNLFTERHKESNNCTVNINNGDKELNKNSDLFLKEFFNNNSPIIGFNIKDSFNKLCIRVVTNLIDIYGLNSISSKEITSINCCGNTLQRNILLRRAVVEIFNGLGVENIFWDFNEAALGAALSLCPGYTKSFC